MEDLTEIKYKTTLIFWKIYDSTLNFKLNQVRDIIENSKYSGKIYDSYYLENNEGKPIPLKWIATTGHLFLPLCFEVLTDEFICRNNPEINGKIQVQAHIFPEGIVCMQAKIDFKDYMKISQLVIASLPTNIIFTDNTDMKTKLDDIEKDLVDLIREKTTKEKPTFGEKASPWHHNWIWWENDKGIPVEEFDIDGKYGLCALGMCTRSDKWQHLDIKNYQQVEKFVNLSPYKGNCVYITHPGNVIIPGKHFTDPAAVKNTLIDVLFATELGNVQRYLILDHLQSFNTKRLEIEEILANYGVQNGNKELDDLIKQLNLIETELNKIILEIYKDLQVTRTNRLIFTSVFKTSIFRRMVEALHGYDFYDNLMTLIDEIRDSLARVRDVISMKIQDEENTFLKNLNVIFIIGLAAQMLTLFYAVDSWDWGVGLFSVVVSILSSLIIIWIIKKVK